MSQQVIFVLKKYYEGTFEIIIGQFSSFEKAKKYMAQLEEMYMKGISYRIMKETLLLDPDFDGR